MYRFLYSPVTPCDDGKLRRMYLSYPRRNSYWFYVSRFALFLCCTLAVFNFLLFVHFSASNILGLGFIFALQVQYFSSYSIVFCLLNLLFLSLVFVGTGCFWSSSFTAFQYLDLGYYYHCCLFAVLL